MNHMSSVEITGWIAGERTDAAERHVRQCAECAAEVMRIERAVGMFCYSARRWSEQPESAPMAAPRWKAGLRVACASAACVVAALLLVRTPGPDRSDVPQQFIEVPFVAPLAPYERAQIQRMDIPVAALAAAGFPMRGPDTGGVVRADVVVGQDGRAHALRFLSDSDRSFLQ
jgi:hypothetical protein